MAFGYAIASVAVERGAHKSVSANPYGCTVPKWASATGALARNVAIPAANARDENSPSSPVSADPFRHALSLGIQNNHRARTTGAR